MNQVLLFSSFAALNPTLLAAMMVMLLLPSPKSLMLGYLLGAMLTSITLGLVIVFSLKNSSLVHTAKHTINPVVDLALGGILLVISLVLGTGKDERLEQRHARRESAKKDKRPPRWQRALDKGNPRITFAVGAVLSLPGASYLAALDGIIKLKPGTTTTVLLVLMVNMIAFVLLEVPLIGFAVAPDWTGKAVERAKSWFARRWRRIAVIGTGLVGLLLVIRGVIELLS